MILQMLTDKRADKVTLKAEARQGIQPFSTLGYIYAFGGTPYQTSALRTTKHAQK